MKVALVNPRVIDTPNHPLGILYVAACMEKQNFDVTVIDPNFDEPAFGISKKVLALNPDIIGISSTTPDYIHALHIAAEIKKQSNLPIVFGGVHPTVLPNEVLENPQVDFVVIGEGEITFPELCKAIHSKNDIEKINGLGYKKDGKILFTKPRELIQDIDSIPFPARHLLPSRWYFAPPRIRGVWTKSTATVMASRGCPYRCIYCSSHLMFGRKVRYRSPENVIKELKELRQKFKIDAVWFADDTFTANPSWTTKVCALIKEQGWKNFKWACQARVNTVNPELLKIMKSAGCVQLDFGVESGSPRVLNILKKDITPEKTVYAFKIAKQAGLLRFASFIIGTPGEKEEDIKLTYALARKIKPDYADFFFAVPYPGTELNSLAKEHGVFEKGVSFNEWLLTKHTDKPVMCTDLREEQLIAWRTKLHNSNFWRNYYTFLKNPRFILGGISIMFKGHRGIKRGLSRFIKTHKLDSIPFEILKDYRMRTKQEKQDISTI